MLMLDRKAAPDSLWSTFAKIKLEPSHTVLNTKKVADSFHV